MWDLPDNNADGAEGTIPYIDLDFCSFICDRLCRISDSLGILLEQQNSFFLSGARVESFEE